MIGLQNEAFHDGQAAMHFFVSTLEGSGRQTMMRPSVDRRLLCSPSSPQKEGQVTGDSPSSSSSFTLLVGPVLRRDRAMLKEKYSLKATPKTGGLGAIRCEGGAGGARVKFRGDSGGRFRRDHE